MITQERMVQFEYLLLQILYFVKFELSVRDVEQILICFMIQSMRFFLEKIRYLKVNTIPIYQ